MQQLGWVDYMTRGVSLASEQRKKVDINGIAAGPVVE